MRRPHALRDWRRLRGRMGGGAWLVLMDYDGTLTPIRPTPAEARLGAGMREAVSALSRARGITVGIVSGRSLEAVRRLVGLRGVVYAGNHGLELQGPGLRFVHPGARRSIPLLRRIARQLSRALAGIPGALVESKRLSLSIHWRRVPAAHAAAFHRRVGAVLAPWAARRAVRVTRGKRVVEVRPPVSWDKGAVVDWLAKRHRCRDGRLLYLGDDRTDEDAFRAVNRRSGIAVFVGRPRRGTAAGWWLRGTQEAGELFRRMAEGRWANRRAR
ncbi:MAG: trehalose-phosphatase [Candidatus Omnitrophica bacterium]|nr:trehalose-phosphatase [Candidatus Omnitrophota bacterium]